MEKIESRIRWVIRSPINGFLVLGIIAQYIGLIYEEVKQRPLYIIAEISEA